MDFSVKKCKIMRITKKKQPLLQISFEITRFWRKIMNSEI